MVERRNGARSGVKLTLLLGALVLLNYVDRGALGIAAPRLEGALGLSKLEFGLAISAFAWVYAPAQFAVGWLADRFCVYRLIAAGLALWSAATLMTGFATTLAWLVAMRVLLGVGEGVAFPAASKIIARHVSPERRGIANGTLAAALAWGPALGTFAGGLLLQWSGWRAIFWVFGGVTLVWIVPWLIVSRSHWSKRGDAAHGDTVPVRAVMRAPAPWLLGIGHFCNTYGFFFLLAWLPLYLVQARGLSILAMTGMTTAVYLVQGAGALLWGAWSDARVRAGADEGVLRKGLMSFYQACMAIAILGAGLSQSTAALFGWLLLAGAVGGIGGSNCYAIAQMFAGPRAAGGLVGIMNGVGNTSGIVGPILTGWLIQAGGGDYHLAFYSAAAIAALGIVWWWAVVPPVARIDGEPRSISNNPAVR